MKFSYTAKRVVITDDVKERLEKKIGKLQKFFSDEADANIVIGQRRNQLFTLEVTIPYNGVVFRAELEERDIFTAIDKIDDVLERQIRKNKTRLAKRLRAGSFNFDEAVSIIEEENQEEEYKVIRTKKFDVKPMDIEEAILQMNMLGHQFYVFANTRNKICVVYKRNDGDYGVLEPEN
ncbi:MAG: ribosome-associated translation inhibitor RaiA [Clostridiales bacterium]|jgi:putative sigma-54 modulation protein|nr:ribosome-associated translation inhibitor RaiA [Clostridiales bacterium]